MALSCITAPTIAVAELVVVELQTRGYEASTKNGNRVLSTAGEWLVAKIISEVTPEMANV